MPEYTILTVIGIVAVLAVELLWARTGMFRSPQLWIALAIVFGFQVPVDGWLTKLSAPIVTYNPDMFLGVRFPLDIPIEDFGFGFAMIVLTLMLWIRTGQPADQSPRQRGPRAAHDPNEREAK